MTKYYNATIKNFSYRLRKFKPVLEQALKEEIKNNEDKIVGLIQTQLYMGLDGYDREIEPSYTSRTRKYKKKKGQPYDRVTLYDTGEFYKSLHIELDEKGFSIVSDDKKADELLEKYGEPILRLMNSSITEIIRVYLRPALTERMKNYIKNGRA